jgi:hypothetical protein
MSDQLLVFEKGFISAKLIGWTEFLPEDVPHENNNSSHRIGTIH